MNPKLPIAQRYAWMLRPDVRAEASAQAPFTDRFKNWWLIKGRAEYPYWAELTKAEKIWLFEPVGRITIEKVEIPIPRAMQLTLQWRSDVLQKFSEDSKTSAQQIAAWFLTIGIGEHLFGSAVNLELIRTLDRPLLHLSNQEPATTEQAPAVSLLMYLAWSLLSPQMQEAMDLKTSATRNAYLRWFFTVGIHVFRCQDVVANRWRSWLLEPISLGEQASELPRFAVFEYASLPPKERPNLKDPKGVAMLRTWAQKIMSPDDKGALPKSKWAWVKTSPVVTDRVSSNGGSSTKKPFGVNLFGFAYGELGLGEDLRMAVETCKAAGVPYRIINIEPGQEIRQNDKGVEKEVLASDGMAPYAINVFCMPGFDTVARIFLKLGDGVFEGHYNIGWWPWEMGVWPKSWTSAFDLVDEVWACSEHSFKMYEKASPKPVIAMPLSASVARTKNFTRKHFGLPERKHLFLYAFDFNSHLVRKNPQALIDAFIRQFAGNRTACLVLKVMNSNSEDAAWKAFQKQLAKNPQIILIDRTLDRAEVLGLIKVCDVYVSPHRAEGFGRTMAEAMLLGKPVVATNYSGNQFYMNPDHTFPVDYQLVPAKQGDYHFVENSDEAVWAEVSIAHLGTQMQAALDACGDRQFIANLMAYAKSVFASERTAGLMAQRLKTIQPELIKRGLM